LLNRRCFARFQRQVWCGIFRSHETYHTERPGNHYQALATILLDRTSDFEAFGHVPPTHPYYLLITTPPPPSESASGAPSVSQVRHKCGASAPQVRRKCAASALQVRALISKMSVSRGRCRKNDAQGSPKSPPECFCSKCAFRLSGSAILRRNPHFCPGKLQF
jgi:hypothetical protein